MSEDLSLAFRGLWRNRSFTLLVVLLLGTGVGATTTVFSAVDAVLLKQLPYPRADRIATVIRRQGRGTGDSQSALTFRFIRDNQQSFGALAASAGGSGTNLAGDGQAAYVRLLSVTSDYFPVLGFEPSLGRTFTRTEEDAGAAPVAILSYGIWQSRFGGRLDILGREIRLTGQPYTIVGVMPAAFRSFFPVDLWVPLKANDPRGVGTNYSVMGRLKDGVTLRQADAEMASLTTTLLQERPTALPNRTTFAVESWQKLLNASAGQSVLVLFAAVLAMLLIVCANSASLALVRALNRQREFALRAALGASRWRLVRQVLIENLVLSAAGSIVGVGFAYWGIRGMLALDPDTYGRWNPALDTRVLAAVAAGTFIIGIVVGLLPAFHSSRLDIRTRLMEEGRQGTSHRVSSLRRVLVTLELAACVVLLSAAGLLLRSFDKLQRVPLGFDGSHVLTAQMSFQGPRFDREGRTIGFAQETLDAIRRLAGVEAAAIASNLPAQRGLNVTLRTAEGNLASPDWRYVTPDYFSVFRIPLLKGRYLAPTDQAGAQPAAVVNEEFVRQFLKTDDVLGAPLTFVAGRNTNFSFNVVGVVGDVKSGNFRVAAAPTVFVALNQAPPEMSATAHQYYPANFVIRTVPGVRVASLAESLQRIVRSVEPNLPLASVQSMDEIVGNALRAQRSQSTFLAFFAALALVTAASGVYALITYSVVMRTREFGIRMALGATYSNVMASVVSHGLALASIATVLGLAGSLFTSRLLRTYLFGVTATDPWTLAITSLILLLAAASASAVPALRVLKVSPSTALRQE